MGRTSKAAIEEKFSQIGTFTKIEIEKLQNNDGQLKGVPSNPRYIKEAEYQTLKRSLASSPEFLEYKPLMVYQLADGNYITICGNMRLKACNELNAEGKDFAKLPCCILHAETPIQKIKEYAIRDNVQSGNFDWDCLANEEWNVEDLEDWGVDCNFLDKGVLADPLEDAEELGDDTYKEPAKEFLECPFCHHRDTKTHFKKVEGFAYDTEEETAEEIEPADEDLNDEDIS